LPNKKKTNCNREKKDRAQKNNGREEEGSMDLMRIAYSKV